MGMTETPRHAVTRVRREIRRRLDTAAGIFPERFAAAASYHGGGLANDMPTSPHLLAGRMIAKVYGTGAIEDANFDDAQKQRLTDALAEAGVDASVETYWTAC